MIDSQTFDMESALIDFIYTSIPLIGLGMIVGILIGIIFIYFRLKNNHERLLLNSTLADGLAIENTKTKKQVTISLIITPLIYAIVTPLLLRTASNCGNEKYGCLNEWIATLVITTAATLLALLTIVIIGIIKAHKLEKKILEAEKSTQTDKR